ncbi:MAG: hypothetical protein NTX85_03060 [Candidatus Nomurabacteria bacterium]|nr:hypothetical protein [Candidatus Nomurabacteria bacterium]
MQLNQLQINKFCELHKDCADFESLSKVQKSRIANGVANHYQNLFKIQQRLKKESENSIKNSE